MVIPTKMCEQFIHGCAGAYLLLANCSASVLNSWVVVGATEGKLGDQPQFLAARESRRAECLHGIWNTNPLVLPSASHCCLHLAGAVGSTSVIILCPW